MQFICRVALLLQQKMPEILHGTYTTVTLPACFSLPQALKEWNAELSTFRTDCSNAETPQQLTAITMIKVKDKENGTRFGFSK